MGCLFSRIAFFMRGQTMKPFFYMRSCRHKAQVCFGTPFLDVKKGEKEASGGNPLNPRVALSIFS